MNDPTRRSFLKTGSLVTAGSLVSGSLRTHVLAEEVGEALPERGVNDQVHFALIGAGGQGMGDTATALRVPGVRLVAVADCYDGRRARAQELWGKDIFTTRDFREVLARPDIDAVIIATPDHWHRPAAVAAMEAGKDVYLEKPMIHTYDDGPLIIETARRTGRLLQVGSQRVSSIIYRKAQELLAAGAIGELNMVNAWWDRNSAMGAWEYSIPPDASPTTIDWERFLGNAPHIPFNPEHFFRWRCWQAYGTGVAGDLFVHLFSGTHFITGSHGPTRGMATGGLRFWKDGRDVPDVMLGLFDYPQGFNLSLRVNFVNGGAESEALVFVGSEGTMEVNGGGVTVTKVPRPKAPGYTIGTFTEAMQQKFLAEYHAKYPPEPYGVTPNTTQERFAVHSGYSDSFDHLTNFFDAVRSRRPVVEDPVFGYRAAGAALLSNRSYFSGKVVNWDPEAMKLV